MRPSSKVYLALDLGTSSLAGRLLDAAGAALAAHRVPNPQGPLGADILSRLELAHQGQAPRLQQHLLQGLRELVAELLALAGREADCIQAAVAAGNPGMVYLLAGLPVEEILLPPHRPKQRSRFVVGQEEVNLGIPVPLEVLPLVSGFVGGDLVAFLFGLEQPRPGTICIDIGTNGELGLYADRTWWVTSAAAGPAFEAANISCGMPAMEGAITAVHLAADRLHFDVLGDGPPRGLCGSGLAALIGAAVAGGMIARDGRILAPEELDTPFARYLDGKGNLLFYRDATTSLRLSQDDVRSFQLAKGAVRAGCEVLMERAGLGAEEVRRVIMTGAFGHQLSPEALKRVALLPGSMVDKTFFVSNGVLDGLSSYLAAKDGPERLMELTAMLRPFPLSGTPAFEKKFLAALDFGS